MDLAVPGTPVVADVAWCYLEPTDGYFYGGWITSSVVGPFKGAPGTAGW